jgi:hypothetical protein
VVLYEDVGGKIGTGKVTEVEFPIGVW